MLWFFKSFSPVVWILFIVYWRIKAANTKTNQRVEPAASGILRALTFLILIVLLSVPRIPLPWLYRQLWPSGLWPFWIGAAVTVVGLLFAIWARQHLPSNWSSAVTIKRDHELGSIGEASAVEPLCEALAYSSSYVQFCALRALEQIQGRKLVNSLIPLLRA
jgi:protein-S-isoprenylcysteine O-methyltransferase Ste14